MAVSTISKIPLMELGSLSSLPSNSALSNSGIYTFLVSANISSPISLPAGCRVIMISIAGIAHGIAIPNATTIYFVRCDTSGWSKICNVTGT